MSARAAPPAPARRSYLRLRTILVLINLVILVLPLGGIAVLRIYESALIRQTESELIAQGAVIAATYETLFARFAQGKAAKNAAAYGLPVSAPQALQNPREPWRPRPAQLDLATDPVYPPPHDPLPATTPADALADRVGHEITPILSQAQYVTLAGIRVLDPQGVIVASTGADRGQSLAHHEEVRRALTGESVSLMRERVLKTAPPPLESVSRGTRIRVFVAVPILHQSRVLGAVLLVRTPANIKQAIWGKRGPLAQGALMLLGVVLLLSLVSALTISRPVNALMQQARRAARGERGAVVPLKHPGTREIAELSETVAAMARELESRAEYIRDFAAHVSHEFKTPLTAIQGAVELLREHGPEMSREERERFLGMVAGDASRLERLVRRLLDLARADMMQPGAERTEVLPLLEQIAHRQRELGQRVELQVGALAAQVAMAPEVLDSVLGALLDNARQHAGPQATVTLGAERSGAELRIRVADDGIGISEANAARIFTPFFTTARERGNTGLGLAIIRSLLRTHGGEIALLPSARGACFEIRLPLTSS